MFFSNSTSKNYIYAMGSPMHYKKSYLLMLTFALAFSVGTAWSYDASNIMETYKTSSEAIYGDNNTSISSTVVDVCLPLLKTSHRTSKSITVRNQRTAGKVAALGIMLGARFALEPNNGNMGSIKSVLKANNKAHKKDSSALAVAAYRRCHKEQALISVASLR